MVENNEDSNAKALREAALEYHKAGTPGKLAIVPTKQMVSRRDLSLAYSPGVAYACEEIEKDPSKALDYTAKGNLVAVISNGTAVLGLGNIGALASKPVMEGKAVLFKKFANIDCIDIEVDELDVDKFIDTVAALEPTFGGINLEDIKAPECFEIERRLRERMKIPVFHDDQHGTAIIVGAAFLNWIHYTGRDMNDVKLVASGAGAASIACLRLLVEAGMPRKNIIVVDRNGVVYKGRNEGMDPAKEEFAVDTDLRELSDAIKGANVFLGLSGPNVLTKDQVKSMADAPLMLTLANPTPEIMPELVREAKPDAIICTGRSDYANQVNNVLCFPFIFRGALDVGATAINEEMKMACVRAIAELARKEVTSEVAAIYPDETLEFGPEYLIPKPFDPRLVVDVSMAVARTAMETGVATRPIEDMAAYKERLVQHFYRTNMVMLPVFNRAKQNPKRVVYTEGEDERVLRAAQTVVDEGLAYPVLVGRRVVVETWIRRLRLRLEEGKHFELVDPEDDPRYRDYWQSYHQIMERQGITPAQAKTIARTNTTVIGAMMLEKGQVDALICGTVGPYRHHLRHIIDIIGLKPGIETAAAMASLVRPDGPPLFICDTHVNSDPTIAQICEMTLQAAEQVAGFGITPKIALLSHSNFGSHETESARKMRSVYAHLKHRAPHLEMDGEMHGDSALSETIRQSIMPNTTLKGAANLLIMPNLDAANISYNLVKVLADAITIGPLLLGPSKPAHIMTNSATTRSIVNMTAVCTVGAQTAETENAPLFQSA